MVLIIAINVLMIIGIITFVRIIIKSLDELRQGVGAQAEKLNTTATTVNNIESNLKNLINVLKDEVQRKN